MNAKYKRYEEGRPRTDLCISERPADKRPEVQEKLPPSDSGLRTSWPGILTIDAKFMDLIAHPFPFIMVLLMAVVTACDTEIHPDLGEPEEIMVIDAWVNQKMERQEIFITRSQAYFENATP